MTIEDNYKYFWKAWIYAHVSALTSRCAPSNYERAFAKKMFMNANSEERKELYFVLVHAFGMDPEWFADKLKRCKKDVDYVKLVKYHFGIK